MYKTPELSQMAKILAEELGAHGVNLKHTQALVMVARMLGARTLQAAQASAEVQAGVRARACALAQAARVMFDTLGRFEDEPYGVISAIRHALARGEHAGSRAVEQAMHELFGQADSPVVSAAYEAHPVAALPELFDALIERLAAPLRHDAQRAPEANETLYQGEMLDWRVGEGSALEELPETHRARFEVRVQRSGQQMLLEIAHPHARPDDIEGTDQLSLWVEVNAGRPCVHLSNDIYGDMLLTVFATRDGLVLRPDESEPMAAHAPQGTALAEFVREQYGAPALQASARQLRFLVHQRHDEN